MTETLEIRSRIMRAVKWRDTKPELAVRRMVYDMGYRYRLHRKDLPGRPDMVFSRLRKVVFIHGCFWHGHYCRRGARVPKSNKDYWLEKFSKNKKRDENNLELLAASGWESLVIWECETQDKEKVKNRMVEFFSL